MDGDPREAMRASLPASVQPLLTWLTAKPVHDQAYVTHSTAYHLLTSVFLTLAGVALSVAALDESGTALLLLPLGLLITSSGIGRFQVLIYHYCAHRAVFRLRGLNDLVGHAVSIVFLFKNFADYRCGHVQHHRIRKLYRGDDEFTGFLTSMLGLRPGEPKAALWRKVLVSLVSPVFHARFFAARLGSTFLSPHRLHGLCAGLYWGGLVLAVAAAGQWDTFLIAWMVPLTILTHISTALRLLCEHRWLPAGSEHASPHARIALSTAAVFPGEPPPRGGSGPARLAAWARWWGRMATVHLFSRIFVLVGDAPVHDYHHRRPGGANWPSYIHARHRDTVRGCPGFPVGYIETWGLVAAIDKTLRSLSDATRWEPPAVSAKAASPAAAT